MDENENMTRPSKRRKIDTIQINYYSQEEVNAVERINKCKNYYEMLGVNKDATEEEIRKSYKKLALKLHPDKNKAPGSADAFKLLARATAILTNQNKRVEYDQMNEEAERKTTLETYGSSNILIPDDLQYLLIPIVLVAGIVAGAVGLFTLWSAFSDSDSYSDEEEGNKKTSVVVRKFSKHGQL